MLPALNPSKKQEKKNFCTVCANINIQKKKKNTATKRERRLLYIQFCVFLVISAVARP